MYSKLLRPISKEIIAIISLAVLSGIIAVELNEFILVEKDHIRVWPTTIAFMPLIFVYIISRQVLATFSGVVLTGLIFFTVAKANSMKQSLTGNPLVWSDISTTANLSIIKHYLPSECLLLLPLILITPKLMLRFRQFDAPTLRKSLFSCMILGLLSPIVFYPYVWKVNQTLHTKVQLQLTTAGISYISWDWPDNVKRSGLPLHLIQTSQTKTVDRPTRVETIAFESLLNKSSEIKNLPRNIVFILCEACWGDSKYFKSEFDPLRRLGFKEFRSISPSYGGGTVNAAFELLTGLPSQGALSGVIYQEYADFLRKDAMSFPRSLKSKGYQTLSIHNHYRKFWRRDIVNPKLGFDRFISLEDMNYNGPIWADDEILFKTALNEIKKSQRPGFYFLTTVATHGGYKFENDFGERDYSLKLKKSLSQLAAFVFELRNIQPDSAILVIGDHKPALTKFFYEKNILPRSIFTSTGDRDKDFQFGAGATPEILGDVPAFFLHSNERISSRFAEYAEKKPFFCLSNFFDQLYAGVDLPAFQYSRINGGCEANKQISYLERVKTFPSYVFSLSLF